MSWWMLSSVDWSSVTGVTKQTYTALINTLMQQNFNNPVAPPLRISTKCTPNSNLVKSNLKFSDLQGGRVAESFWKEYSL